MDTDKLITMIERHPAYTHPIFDQLAKRRPHDGLLEIWLYFMGNFCEFSRSARNMPASLRNLGLHAQAGLIEEIDKSEAGHGPQFDRMVGKLLEAQTDSYSVGMGFFPGPALMEMSDIFDMREVEDPYAVMFSLGVFLAIEKVANGHIIPGEIKCFITSGLYGVTIENEDMEYLREHAGDLGAEASHEKRMLQAIEAIEENVEDAYGIVIKSGIALFMDTLGRFYDELADVIRE